VADHVFSNAAIAYVLHGVKINVLLPSQKINVFYSIVIYPSSIPALAYR